MWTWKERDVCLIPEKFEIFKKKYSNLNDVNWEEYAIYHEGDKVILGTNTSALHDVVELIVSDNGYILHHECIDNAGTIDKSLNIPFGSFKDLSLIELKDNFKEAGSKVSWYYLYVSPDKATQIILTDRVICRSRDKD